MQVGDGGIPAGGVWRDGETGVGAAVTKEILAADTEDERGRGSDVKEVKKEKEKRVVAIRA